MSFTMAPTGQQNMSQSEIDRFLKEAREAPNEAAPPVLGIRQVEMMQAKRNGFPKWMYHATFEPRHIFKAAEQTAAEMMGYTTTYVFRAYPKVLYRRNMDAKFEPQFEEATGLQLTNAFVQAVTVRDEKHEKEVRAMKPKQGQSAWFETLAQLPEIEDAPTEDPAVTIARLQGEIDGMKSKKAA
jgi:hypothetical protein